MSDRKSPTSDQLQKWDNWSPDVNVTVDQIIAELWDLCGRDTGNSIYQRDYDDELENECVGFTDDFMQQIYDKLCPAFSSMDAKQFAVFFQVVARKMLHTVQDLCEQVNSLGGVDEVLFEGFRNDCCQSVLACCMHFSSERYPDFHKQMIADGYVSEPKVGYKRVDRYLSQRFDDAAGIEMLIKVAKTYIR